MCMRVLLPIVFSLLLITAQAQEELTYDENEEEDRLATQQHAEPGGQDGSESASGFPGEPGFDYPTFKRVPATFFTCEGRLVPGYYADIETRCQAFHICGDGGAKHSFLCPEGSVFNQKYLVCDWWYKAACDDTVNVFTDQIEFSRLQPKQETRVFIPGNHQNYVFLTNEIFHTAETGLPVNQQTSEDIDASDHGESNMDIKSPDDKQLDTSSENKVKLNELRIERQNSNSQERRIIAREKPFVLRKSYSDPSKTKSSDITTENLTNSPNV